MKLYTGKTHWWEWVMMYSVIPVGFLLVEYVKMPIWWPTVATIIVMIMLNAITLFLSLNTSWRKDATNK